MKKFIAMLLALVLVFSLCACGSKDDVSGSLAPADKGGSTSGSVSQTPEPAQEPEEEIEAGNLVGGRYENEFLGIGCELDDNWVYATQEELAEMIGQTADLFDEESAEQLKNADMFYDMLASSSDGLVSINVVIQNLGVLYGAVLSEEEYVSISTQNLEEQLGTAGFTDISWEQTAPDFAGQQHVGLHISSKIQGNDYYTSQVYIKAGSYMAVISFNSFLEDIGEDLMANFFAL